MNKKELLEYNSSINIPCEMCEMCEIFPKCFITNGSKLTAFLTDFPRFSQISQLFP